MFKGAEMNKVVRWKILKVIWCFGVPVIMVATVIYSFCFAPKVSLVITSQRIYFEEQK